MHSTVVMTFLGADKPGLVKRLAALIAEHQGSWQESQLTHVAGQFAGIVVVQIPQAQAQPLCDALSALSHEGLNVQPVISLGSNEEASHQLELIGPDRPGIIHELARVMAEQGLNVLHLSSEVISAPMSGEPLFSAELTVSLPAGSDEESVQRSLEQIAEELTVEIAWKNND